MLLTNSEIKIPNFTLKLRTYSWMDGKHNKIDKMTSEILHCSGPTHESCNMLLYFLWSSLLTWTWYKKPLGLEYYSYRNVQQLIYTQYFKWWSIYTKTNTKYPRINLGVLSWKINIFMQDDSDNCLTNC